MAWIYHCFFLKSCQEPPMGISGVGLFPVQSGVSLNKFSGSFRCRKCLIKKTSDICVHFRCSWQACGVLSVSWFEKCTDVSMSMHLSVFSYVYGIHYYVCMSLYVHMSSHTSKGHPGRMSVCLSGIFTSVSTSISMQAHPLFVGSFITVGLSHQLININVCHLLCHVWLAWIPCVFWVMFKCCLLGLQAPTCVLKLCAVDLLLWLIIFVAFSLCLKLLLPLLLPLLHLWQLCALVFHLSSCHDLPSIVINWYNCLSTNSYGIFQIYGHTSKMHEVNIRV